MSEVMKGCRHIYGLEEDLEFGLDTVHSKAYLEQLEFDQVIEFNFCPLCGDKLKSNRSDDEDRDD